MRGKNSNKQQDIFHFNFLVTVKEKTSQTGHYIIIKNADDLMKMGKCSGNSNNHP